MTENLRRKFNELFGVSEVDEKKRQFLKEFPLFLIAFLYFDVKDGFYSRFKSAKDISVFLMGTFENRKNRERIEIKKMVDCTPGPLVIQVADFDESTRSKRRKVLIIRESNTKTIAELNLSSSKREAIYWLRGGTQGRNVLYNVRYLTDEIVQNEEGVDAGPLTTLSLTVSGADGETLEIPFRPLGQMRPFVELSTRYSLGYGNNMPEIVIGSFCQEGGKVDFEVPHFFLEAPQFFLPDLASPYVEPVLSVSFPGYYTETLPYTNQLKNPSDRSFWGKTTRCDVRLNRIRSEENHIIIEDWLEQKGIRSSLLKDSQLSIAFRKDTGAALENFF